MTSTLTFFENIKLYVGFTDASSTALRELHPVAEPFFASIVDDFYAAIEAHPGARQAITGGAAQIDRLKQTLIRWMDKMLLGPHDEAYYELRSKIGRMHVRIALPQAYMFTAMDRIRVRLLGVLRTAFASDSDKVERIATALNQILDLELAIMLETYREDLETKHRNAERLATIGQFAASIGNELRNPLGLVESSLVLVRQHLGELVAAQPDVAQHLDRIGSEIQRANRTIHDLLDLARDRPPEILRRLLRSERLAAVGTMAAGLAHEVRNPLNSASLQLTLLQRRLERGDTPAATLPIADVIKSEIDRLDHLVRDFLAFARPHPIETKPVDVGPLLAGVAGLIAPEAEAAKVTIDVQTDGPPPILPILGDEERLRQVLLNLTRNAIEAMAERGGQLRLTARTAGTEVEIDVQDDGLGFGEDLPVFDAFFTTKPQGTGLGLAIAHRIVADHGGTIRVESRPGRTCFTLALPAAT